jgi:acetylornithine deacetylase/succinyl-diaminopimelate desuccinylase-like protein|tara:strand:+ start:36382 stop:37749 length:1368 start_codon:yes stop_codon:yes gene_type:complete
MKTKEYIENNKERFLEELFELLKIPSVSADPSFKEEVSKAADYLVKQLQFLDLDNIEKIETKGHPIVYAEKIIDKDLPTILVYGHYDVQPADPYELWESPPFEPVIKNEKIYARGSCDDKGQMYMHLKAYETLKELDEISFNIKFMIEGEEECGSDNLEKFVIKNKEKLKADVIVISDTSIVSNDTPSITIGLRGLTYLEVELTGPNRDLHSGTYGGAVNNPINELCKIIASLKDDKGKITIPRFYDNVKGFSESERKDINKVPFEIKEFKSHIDIGDVFGEDGYTTIERIGIRPTLDINGIWGGYTKEGSKTVLPSKAFAKISMRLVSNQNSSEITKLFTSHVKSLCPTSCEIIVREHHGGEPVVVQTNTEGYKAAHKAFNEVWGKDPVPTYDGGSIPIVALFKKELKLDSILMGFGLDEDAIHSPNESFGLFNFYKGIETITVFYKNFSKIHG